MIFSSKFMRRPPFGGEISRIRWLIWRKSIFQLLDKYWLDFFLLRERHYSKNNLTISWHLCKAGSIRFYWSMSFLSKISYKYWREMLSAALRLTTSFRGWWNLSKHSTILTNSSKIEDRKHKPIYSIYTKLMNHSTNLGQVLSIMKL